MSEHVAGHERPQSADPGHRRPREFFGPHVFRAPLVAPGPQPAGDKPQGIFLGHADRTMDLMSDRRHYPCCLSRAYFGGSDRPFGGRQIAVCIARANRSVDRSLRRSDFRGERGQLVLDGLE